MPRDTEAKKHIAKCVDKTPLPLYVAYHGDHPVGLMNLMYCFTSILPEIDLLVTHPAASGVGGELIRTAVNVSQEVGHIYLTTPYKAAKGIYESLGFNEKQPKLNEKIRNLLNQRNNQKADDNRNIDNPRHNSALHLPEPLTLHLFPKKSKNWKLGKDKTWVLKSSNNVNQKTAKTKKAVAVKALQKESIINTKK